jgi:hypothetical protein
MTTFDAGKGNRLSSLEAESEEERENEAQQYMDEMDDEDVNRAAV